MQMDDKMPNDFVAEMDQNIRAQKDVAEAHATFRRGLLENGVPPADALSMTLIYIQTIHGRKPNV